MLLKQMRKLYYMEIYRLIIERI